MRVENTTFHFAGHESIVQGNKSVKKAVPKLSDHPVSVSMPQNRSRKHEKS